MIYIYFFFASCWTIPKPKLSKVIWILLRQSFEFTIHRPRGGEGRRRDLDFAGEGAKDRGGEPGGRGRRAKNTTGSVDGALMFV